MNYKEILVSFEANEIDFISAMELSNCGSLLDLYEKVADEVGKLELDFTQDADAMTEHAHTRIIANLMEAQDLAEAAQEPLLASLIGAVLLEAGMRLVSDSDRNWVH